MNRRNNRSVYCWLDRINRSLAKHGFHVLHSFFPPHSIDFRDFVLSLTKLFFQQKVYLIQYISLSMLATFYRIYFSMLGSFCCAFDERVLSLAFVSEHFWILFWSFHHSISMMEFFNISKFHDKFPLSNKTNKFHIYTKLQIFVSEKYFLYIREEKARRKWTLYIYCLQICFLFPRNTEQK